MTTIYIPGFGNTRDKISAQLPDNTIIIQETMGTQEIDSSLITTIKTRTERMLNQTASLQQIQSLIQTLQEAKAQQNDEQKRSITAKLTEKRTLLIENTDLRHHIQQTYPGTTISDLATKLMTIFADTQDQEEIIKKIKKRFGSYTKSWDECIQDTKTKLLAIMQNSEKKQTIYAHSQGGLLLGHVFTSLSEQETNLWNENVENIVLVTPVSQPQEAKDFHKTTDGFRQSYLHFGRDLIVTQDFLDSLTGSDLEQALNNTSPKPSIILGAKDPYLPGWNQERIEEYKDKGYTVDIVAQGDHYPSLPNISLQDLPNRTKNMITGPISSIDYSGQKIWYFTFDSNQVPEKIQEGGGGMISKIVDSTHATKRIIMAEPQNEGYKQFMRYSILHERLDNTDTENSTMLAIEKKVFAIFTAENNPSDEIKQLFIKSRLQFFQGQYDQNITNGTTEDDSHNQGIQETLQWLKTQNI